MPLLRVFNNTTEVSAAGRYKMKDILELFDKMKKDHKAYGVDEGSAPSLATVVDNIKALSDKPAGASRVAVHPPVQAKYQTAAHTFGLETLFDLVGWVFSVAGSAPPNATRDNFFYPLAGLYSYFSAVLVGKKTNVPQMIQMTWFKRGDVTHLVLGANLDSPRGTKKNAIRERRFDQLASAQNGLCAASEKLTTHVDQASGVVPQYFGTCAETFPCMFVHSLKLDKSTLGAAQGFATKASLVAPESGHYTYDKQPILEHFADPCENCEILLRKVGLNDAHFLKPN